MKSVRWILLIVVVFNLLLCCGGLAIVLFAPTPGNETIPSNTIVIGYSPEKEALFTKLVDGFNGSGSKYQVRARKVDPDDLVDTATGGTIAAISPDSAIWLDQIDRAWIAKHPESAGLVASLTRYAASPIVIAAWQSVAADLGYPRQPVGWNTIMERALRDPSFRWSHPASSTASGLLALTAEFYAGSGNPARLVLEDIQRESTLDYVRQIERSVQQYGGETEDQLITRLLANQAQNLDALVVQEQFVLLYNGQTKGEKLTAIYPAEGTLWLDHPLALLEGPWLTNENRQAYRAFVQYLGRPETGNTVLGLGYRPADLSIAIDESASPIRWENGVDPAQPTTSLVLPSTAVLERIRDSWSLLKRPANIYLVADVSGSMAGERLNRAREALLSFIDQIQDGRDRVALVSFSSTVQELAPLDTLDKNRGALQESVKALQPGGNTAFYDAVDFAAGKLAQRKEPDRINVVLAMTDGEENASRRELVAGKGDPSALISALQARSRQAGVPIIVFNVAYGGEAELGVLTKISVATNGQAYRSDPETIRKLYKLLSQAF